ncbi:MULTISPECIES: LysR family transcriptional regulator [unclassified Variovorax]|uniref:LysR family transcriptional regulator n=1 Tax=unclassified Variovorax TaxID=663243 RepID=UPI0032E5AEF0
MNLNDLHLAVVIAREGGLSHASACLGISPGTLSKAVTRLERATKVKLFERLARGMRPTELGQAFLKRAQRIDLDAADLHAELRDLRQARAGVLRCGVGDGIPDRWVLPVVAALIERGIRVDLSGGNSDSLTRAVAMGELEFALTGLHKKPTAALAWEGLRDDPLLPMAPIGHPLARTRREVGWDQLAQARWIVMAPGTSTHTEFEANFRAHRLDPPEPVGTSRSSQRELALVRSLGALMPVPRSVLKEPPVAAQFVPVSPVGGWRSTRRVGIVRRAGGYLSPSASQAMEALEAILRKER